MKLLNENEPSIVAVQGNSSHDAATDHASLNLPTKLGPEGSQCAIQTVYEGKSDCKCCKKWVEHCPKDLGMGIEEQPETKQKAMVVRMGRNHGEGKSLVVDSIVVQSPSLKKTLGEVFEGYRGITPSLKKLVFMAPFHPFYYRWNRFTEILERQKREDPEAAAYSQLLYSTLDEELGEKRAEIEDHVRHGVITYPLAWALFEPGERVFGVEDGCERIFVVESTKYDIEMGMLQVNVMFIDFTGAQLGYATTCFYIPKFRGTQDIASFECYPVSFDPSREEKEARALARGKKFRELLGLHHMDYSGTGKVFISSRTTVSRNIDGRVIIDAASYYEETTSKIMMSTLESDAASPEIVVADAKHNESTTRSAYSRREPPRANRSRQLELNKILGSRGLTGAQDLTDGELMLCNSWVRGYSLKLKKWGEFEVEKVRDIVWNEGAFSNLMLPRGYKTLIESFVSGQLNHKETFDDIIKGKGLGVIMLLAGNPGIGKTLTAEAIADKVQRPMYTISSGELGKTAEDLEKRLATILNLAEKWDAVLLFDECDVFLQDRKRSALAHNEIVAVFLRILEYYRGILIMTSNRADAIDHAFHSRIHLTLEYPDLDSAAKEHIWRQLVPQSRQAQSFTDEMYRRLAQLPLNGRQIKNTIKISTLLAAQAECPLSMEQIRTVLQATLTPNARVLLEGSEWSAN